MHITGAERGKPHNNLESIAMRCIFVQIEPLKAVDIQKIVI